MAADNSDVTDVELRDLFLRLVEWADDYLDQEDVILERATKAQPFTDYLLKCAKESRQATAAANPPEDAA
jgi:hypothetical protein